jgi:hypothetical protein
MAKLYKKKSVHSASVWQIIYENTRIYKNNIWNKTVIFQWNMFNEICLKTSYFLKVYKTRILW